MTTATRTARSSPPAGSWPGLRRATEWALRPLLRLSADQASFATRGFGPAAPAARRRLEAVGRTFIEGYNVALDHSDLGAIGARLDLVSAADRGFSYEGAAMALALRDALTPWGERLLPRFIAGHGAPHLYMVLVGAGWALARLRRRLSPAIGQSDPLLGWLLGDGYGFHEGYFGWRRYVARCRIPRRLVGYELRAFDQGLGRSVWFVCGASVPRIVAALAGFAECRRGDLWSGIGLAAAYAGGAPDADLLRLRAAAGRFRPMLAQGAAFAAKARERAGNAVAHTEAACEALCGCGAAAAAAAVDAALVATPPATAGATTDSVPRYERWRRAVARELGYAEGET